MKNPGEKKKKNYYQIAVGNLFIPEYWIVTDLL